MDRLLAAIQAQAAAADALTLACTNRSIFVVDKLRPGVLPFRRAFKVPLVTPVDMLATLGKMK